MDLGANVGSGHSGDNHHQGHPTDMAESLRFQEIQSLMRENLIDSSSSENNNNNNGGAGGGSSSFTALLGLPPNQAMELLHHEIVPVQQPPPLPEQRLLDLPFRCYPTFPSNAALVERAARYSVFAAEGSPEASAVPSNAGNNSSPNVKSEPADSDSNPGSSFPADKPKRGGGKRKEPEKNKVKSGGKKTKSNGGEDGENKNGGGGDKLPYVHVRARRGQATDSHSLAERARREKINARMKLLQELVPGCSKITGTALVLDEIINHVQSLQRQVEFLSMRLAAVNPRIDFGGLDNFLSGENTRLCGGNGEVVGMEASMWPEVHVEGVRREQPQQIWQVDLLPSHRSSSLWEKEDNHRQAQQHHGFISPGPSLLSYDSANPVPLHTNQLKTEL